MTEAVADDSLPPGGEIAAPEVVRSPREPRDGVPPLIDSPQALQEYCGRLARGAGPVAIDAERASGFRYGQRAYLIQLRRSGSGTALIDPIAVPDLSPLQKELRGTEWILHAATQDLPCLAEVGLVPDALFDTELAGRLLGRERVGLAALVLSELGEVIEKGHGATDWSVRPLSPAQLRYAALDVELLVELRDALEQELERTGKAELARQEFDSLLSFRARDRSDEDWRRTSGLHRVRQPRVLAIVREVWRERDAIGQERDIAVGRLIPDSAVIAAAQSTAASRQQLLRAEGFHGRGAQRYLPRWWAAVERGRACPEPDWPTPAARSEGPPPARAWADRDPAAHARLSSARAGLADVAEAMGMPVENLLSPETVRRLCWAPPETVDADTVTTQLLALGARTWQVEASLPVLLTALDAPVVTDE